MPEPVARLPLFPLYTVLFPGQILPLHIFEPRYRAMVERCLGDETPFGVVLIREGREVGGWATPHRVGTTARIVQADSLPDGRMNIAAVGEARFRISQLHYDEPYLTADVVAWPWAEDENILLALKARQVRQYLQGYIAALARPLGHLVEIGNMPAQPLALACLVAIALQVPVHEKQDLLVSPTAALLMDKEMSLLARETRLLRLTNGIPTRLLERGERITSDN